MREAMMTLDGIRAGSAPIDSEQTNERSKCWKIEMVDQVWISEVKSNGELFDKLGLRDKWYGEPWEAPYVRHYIPDRSNKVNAALDRYALGHTMKREEMPEASAVYSMSHFKRAKDVFSVGGFLAVKGRVAEVLSRFDFGTGGGLVPYTIYEADEKTPLPGPFYIVNFGPQKDCFRPDASAGLLPDARSGTRIEKLGVDQKTGLTHWTVRSVRDDDVALSPSALEGADLWTCPGVKSRIFMSNRVVEALNASSTDVDFVLHRCRIVG
jgi:hypothetical protein